MKTYVSPINIEKLSRRVQKSWLNSEFIVTDDISPAINYEPVRPDFYGMAYCFQGNYKAQLSGEDYNLLPGHIMFFNPLEVHHTLEMHDYSGILVAFNRHFFVSNTNANLNILSQPFFTERNKKTLKLPDTKKAEIEFYFKTLLLKESELGNKNRMKIMRSILSALMYELNAIYPKEKLSSEKDASRANQLIRDFFLLLNENFLEQKKVSFYSNRLNITSGYLSELLKEITGRSAKEHINDKIWLEAKILIKSTNQSISNISQYLNYANTSAFIRFFKKYEHTSPSQYRKGLQE